MEEKKETQGMKTWKKNLIAGAVCFAVGASCAGAIGGTMLKNQSKRNAGLYTKIHETEKALKKAEENTKTVYVTVPFYVTESIETTKVTAPVTDVPETETTVSVSETETEAADQISDDDIRALTNPLTKTPPYKVTPPAPAQYTIYWIDVKRSDLAGMTADDFTFFSNYINEKYNTDDNVRFYVRLTDFPDIIMEFFIPNYGMDADISISKEDTKDHCYRADYDSCVMDFTDPSQIKLTGIKKDEYNLPAYDEDEVYYFSEFNEDMFSQIQKFQDHAKFLFG